MTNSEIIGFYMHRKMKLEIFKTDVCNEEQAARLANRLLGIFPGLLINFDLDDCDRIMRIRGHEIDPSSILAISFEAGFSVSLLPD